MPRQAPAKTKSFPLRLCDVSFDARSGDLISVKWKKPALEVIREPRLGENFQILLPRPDYQANYFYSKEQRVARFDPIADGVVCVYEGLRNERETIDVSVRYTLRVQGEQLTFAIEVDNRTDLPLAEVYFGMIGGQHGVGDRLATKSVAVCGWFNPAEGWFQNQAGQFHLGIRHNAWGVPYPAGLSMPWLSIYNEKVGRAIYYANHDVETRQSVLHCELRPYGRPANRGNQWPRAVELPKDEPMGLTLGWMNTPYARRGTHRFGPVVLQVHRGDWHEACHIYRAWFDRQFPMPVEPNWLRREHAWQSIIMSNPEDVIIHRFKDLPKLAADAKKYGVTTFEILGWDVGGIDRGYPQYTPDPRLGTVAEFVEALQKIRALGVRPLIFANIQVADTGTKQWKKELHQYAVQGRWAEDLTLVGYGEGTHAGRLGIVRPNMAVVSAAHTRFRELIVRQMRELIRQGAAGLQLDKNHPIGQLDFNPRLPTSPDRSTNESMLAATREVVEACREEDPSFALASETAWDRMFPLVEVSYTRLWTVDMPGPPALRYAFPEWTATVFTETPGDYVELNNGMRYGLTWAMAPRHYAASLDDPLTRPLSRYLRELIRIRQRHEDVLFLGRFLDTRGGVTVRSTGPNVRHSVFESRDGRRKACVVVNHEDRPATATVAWPGGRGRAVEVCQPFQRNRTARLPVRLQLPPQSCAVFVELELKKL